MLGLEVVAEAVRRRLELVEALDVGPVLTGVAEAAGERHLDVEAGVPCRLLDGTNVEARPLHSDNGYRRIALVWRHSSPREEEFQLLAATLRRIATDVVPSLAQQGAGSPRRAGAVARAAAT